MTIKIKDQTQTTTYLESTSTIVSGEGLPRIVFSRQGWKFLEKPTWTTNEAPQREGDYKHYNGRRDKTGKIILYLAGATRNANLETLRSLDNIPIYLDCDDINSNDSGLYIIDIADYERNEDAQLITIDIKLEAYNN